MESLISQELTAISAYIRFNYYSKLQNKQSPTRNTIIDHGIVLIIHKYCKPLLLTTVDARLYSRYFYGRSDGDDYDVISLAYIGEGSEYE